MKHEQREAAQQELISWLAHAKELGKAPAKIEFVEEFSLGDKQYCIFRFQKNYLDNKWLLGVSGGFDGDSVRNGDCIVSDFEEFSGSTAVECAMKMVQRELAGSQTEQEEELFDYQRGGPFVSFVLLDECQWSMKAFTAALENRWGIKVAPDGAMDRENGDTLVWEVDGMLATISLMRGQVPDGEAEQNAANNYLWPKAVEVTQSHVGHVLVAVIPRTRSLIDAGQLLVQLCDACLVCPHTVGVYTAGTVFQPEYYRDCAKVMETGELPYLNWIYFGLPSEGHGHLSGYTYGLNVFGKDEIEVLDATASRNKMRSFLLELSAYVLANDVILQDGDTIGFSEEQKLTIVRSPGVYLKGDTVKIDYISPPGDSE